MPKWGLSIFEFFCNFFRNFHPRIEYEWNLRLKVFSLFFSLSHPVLAKNKAGKRFFNLLNYFALVFGIFFGIFNPGSGMNGIWHKRFFISLSASYIPFWLKTKPERGFLIFLIFLLLFSEFSSEFLSSGRVWTEFGTKSFFSLFQPVKSRFG